MGFKSFKSSGEEQGELLTSPNAISVARGAGGVVLGAMLATNNIDPSAAVVAAGGLAASDMEGSLIQATSRWPKFQRTIRAIPSTVGRKLDPVMDKIFAASVFTGAVVGGYMPIEQAGPILATEAATASTTIYVTQKGGDPEVGKAGTIGMAARMGSMVLNLAASASESGQLHEALTIGGVMSTIAAVGLGALSCRDIWKQRPTEQTNCYQEAA